ncbi:hypothetical protein GUJ93_ZPchr0002g24903 [Zizania palustris]|uniref:Uncharacterized protein n=1 Tax=Zizania palustris TaxID=103762 RepID=A0A8J5VVB2_ZIZPA|nr:hypothetical protein GUJ93_ZPchr0002g24903 [Zizania palustris]
MRLGSWDTSLLSIRRRVGSSCRRSTAPSRRRAIDLPFHAADRFADPLPHQAAAPSIDLPRHAGYVAPLGLMISPAPRAVASVVDLAPRAVVRASLTSTSRRARSSERRSPLTSYHASSFAPRRPMSRRRCRRTSEAGKGVGEGMRHLLQPRAAVGRMHSCTRDERSDDEV